MKIRVVKVYEKELTPYKAADGMEWIDSSCADSEPDAYNHPSNVAWFEKHGYAQPSFPITKDNVQDALAVDHIDHALENFNLEELNYAEVEVKWELLDDSGLPYKPA